MQFTLRTVRFSLLRGRSLVDKTLTPQQQQNVAREIERQRRKHEAHDMMRRGTFKPRSKSSKKGKR